MRPGPYPRLSDPFPDWPLEKLLAVCQTQMTTRFPRDTTPGRTIHTVVQVTGGQLILK